MYIVKYLIFAYWPARLASFFCYMEEKLQSALVRYEAILAVILVKQTDIGGHWH